MISIKYYGLLLAVAGVVLAIVSFRTDGTQWVEPICAGLLIREGIDYIRGRTRYE